MVKVSVVMPVYNVKKYLGECLDSLMEQSFADCEFICIDDGSVDDSHTIVEKYRDKDRRFKLIRQENKGPAETRNVGIRNARGKYIAFLDADDFFTNNGVLDKLYRKAEEDNLEIVSFETELFYEGSIKEKDNKDFYYYKNYTYDGIREGRNFFVEMMENHEYCDSACLLFIKREWLLEQGIMFYPGILYEDALFCIRCFLRSERMAHLSERLYTYRIREKSIMTTAVRWVNVRSRIILYREILYLMIAMEKHGERLRKAMADYLSLISFHAKYLDDFRVDEQSDTVLEPFDALLLKTMSLGDYRVEVNEDVILNGLEKIVSESEGIILYGAGKVGKLFYDFLTDQGLAHKVVCFAVSGNQIKKTFIDGIPVLSIGEAVNKKCKIFLSVVERQAQKDMRETLKQLGVDRFEFCDQYIYRALRHYAQGREAAERI